MKLISFLATAIILPFTIACSSKAGITTENIDSIDIKTIIIENNLSEYSETVYTILSKIDKNKPVKIIFEKGIYNFFPGRAYQEYLTISNNDNGLKSIAFPIKGLKNIIIDGNGSEFIFHGKMVPFFIENSSMVEIKNFTVSWDIPFDLEGLVVANNEGEKSFDIKINEANQYFIKQGRLFFKGYDWELPLGENIIFNPVNRRPYFNTSIYEHNWQNNELAAKEIGPRLVRLSGTTGQVPPIGSIYVDKGPFWQNRNCPVFSIKKSANISLNNIEVNNAGAMALIAQKTKDITLRHFNVRTKPNSKTIISATADATHFVNCSGLIKLDSCIFESMLDDATNIHGIYEIVDKILDANTIAIIPGHGQQKGFEFASTGDSIRFIDRKTLLPVRIAIVTSFLPINEAYSILKVDNLAGLDTNSLYAVENISWMASAEINACSVQLNRARGFLISTSKKVEIKNNYFSSMMAGIKISGDANYWFESGPVSDVLIQNNTFEDLGIGGHNPQAILQIDPVIGSGARESGFYHRNIVFENNIIKTFDPLIIYALSVDKLIIRGNKILQTDSYPEIFDNLAKFDIQNCKNVIIEDNQYIGKGKGEISILDCNSKEIIIGKQIGFSEQTVKKPNKYFYQN